MENIAEKTIPKPFQIQVDVFELRNLSCPGKDAPVPNPYVVVKVGIILIIKAGPQERETEIRYNQINLSVNERFHFKIETTVDELKTMKISFVVWHKTPWYSRDILIGSYSLDIWTVYSKATKMINRDWEPLERELGEAGYIQYSVVCVAEEDRLMGIVII